MDPDPTEESLAQSVHLFAFACSGHVVESEGTALEDGSDDLEMTDADIAPPVSKTSEAKLVLAESAGKVDLALVRRKSRPGGQVSVLTLPPLLPLQHQECVRLARKAALTVHATMRRRLRDQFLG